MHISNLAPSVKFPDGPELTRDVTKKRYYMDDDWLRIYFSDRGFYQKSENHEMCGRYHCAYSTNECSFHPAGCKCSNGMCQVS